MFKVKKQKNACFYLSNNVFLPKFLIYEKRVNYYFFDF